MSKFVISKETFVDNFITPLSRFDLPDKAAHVLLEDEQMIGVTHSNDRHIILEATLKNVVGEDFKHPIILKDLNRLLSALGFVSESMLTFDVGDIKLEYKDDLIRFKSFYLADRFFDDKVIPKLGKIKDQKIDFTFKLTQDALSKIRKSKQFVAQDTDKVYFYGQNGSIIASRHDDTKQTIDTISFNICSYDGPDFDPLPIHITAFDLISEKKESILVEINKEFGLFLMKSETADYKLQYITSALRK